MKLLIIILSGLLFLQAANAELMIEITEGSDSALPIAVVPFANKGGFAVPYDVSRIVANDLQRSGDFDTLSSSKMLSLPEKFDQVHFRDWRMLGQNYVLIGQSKYSEYSKKYEISYELIDVLSQKRVLGEVLSAGPKGLRKLAHKISDAVYEAITGVRGVFSTKIAYITVAQLTKNKQEYKLYVADADGKNDYILFKSNQPMLSLSWSNDGQHLAYSSFHSGRPAIYIQHVRSGHQRKVTSFKGLNGAPMWSPDDSSLVMTLSKDGNAEIYAYDLATNKLNRLTNHYGIDTEASWSPNGKEVVFTSDRSGSPQVYRMSIKEKKPVRLTFVGSYNARPRFSSDGQSLYYVHQANGGFHIAAINMKTEEQLVLTSETSLDESPSVSPNGRMIIYSTLRGKHSVLAVVSVDGGAKYFLPSESGDVREPAWSPFLN
jgi:TolB protein